MGMHRSKVNRCLNSTALIIKLTASCEFEREWPVFIDYDEADGSTQARTKLFKYKMLIGRMRHENRFHYDYPLPLVREKTNPSAAIVRVIRESQVFSIKNQPQFGFG
jgi:hypothetical protein